MNRFNVRKVAVLGAGVMGAQIAAHLTNAGVKSVLFDLAAKEGPKNGIVTKAVENLKDQLASVGASLTDVAKTLCFLTDMDTFATFNDAYVEGFGTHRPARSTIGVAALPAGGAVEIEAWAYKPVG